MRVRIPDWLATAWDRVGDWSNVEVYHRVRRIDVALVIFGIICVGYYGWVDGWRGAITGAAMYILITMMAIWLL